MQLQLMSHPFQQMAMDIVGPLEDTQSGSRYILVVCNYFSKWPLYRAVCILRWDMVENGGIMAGIRCW
ncbi:hypothetical protein T4B_4244 [Trichinella pseudospiralis]|uniref:Uncharacterized protein n=1 Tax=Trichinella pseudospiralis TaxID=6337 RepID=A0A0V1JVF7_TRIPS|nr:hypothetical protein T4B_4244 [Trichinella pseudospiralis]KRZ38959.1 hypothetical protein T4C_2650 [Trichinella pseudospiralis]